MEPGAPRLLDLVRARLRFRHYSIRTEQAYVDWIKRYIRFHGNRHPAVLGPADLECFLTHLATELEVAASTQNQAQSAILFLYREVLGRQLPWLENVVRAKAPIRLPVVLTQEEVATLLCALPSSHRVFGELLYGTGLRIMEGARLRVKDVDLARREILVRDGKGAKDRVTMLPQRLVPALRRQLQRARQFHALDVTEGFGAVWLPPALARSIRPPITSGHGNTFFPPIAARSILAAASSAAITSATSPFSARSAKRFATAASPSPPRRTRCATRSRLTCWRRATTSAPCRSYSGMRT